MQASLRPSKAANGMRFKISRAPSEVRPAVVMLWTLRRVGGDDGDVQGSKEHLVIWWVTTSDSANFRITPKSATIEPRKLSCGQCCRGLVNPIRTSISCFRRPNGENGKRCYSSSFLNTQRAGFMLKISLDETLKLSSSLKLNSSAILKVPVSTLCKFGSNQLYFEF